MNEFKLGVIDDEFESRASMYEAIFKDFDITVEHISEKSLREEGQNEEMFAKYQAIIVDIWLSHHDEFQTLSSILPLINEKPPIIFLSSEFHKIDTLNEVLQTQVNTYKNKCIMVSSISDLVSDLV